MYHVDTLYFYIICTIGGRLMNLTAATLIIGTISTLFSYAVLAPTLP
jgi:hypothetical protein